MQAGPRRFLERSFGQLRNGSALSQPMKHHARHQSSRRRSIYRQN